MLKRLSLVFSLVKLPRVVTGLIARTCTNKISPRPKSAQALFSDDAMRIDEKVCLKRHAQFLSNSLKNRSRWCQNDTTLHQGTSVTMTPPPPNHRIYYNVHAAPMYP